jgi:hypothetical protein
MSFIGGVLTLGGAIIAGLVALVLVAIALELECAEEMWAKALGIVLGVVAVLIVVGTASAFVYSAQGVPVTVGTFTLASSDVPAQVVASSNIGENGTVQQVRVDADTDKLFNPGSVTVTARVGIPETGASIPDELLIIHPGGGNDGVLGPSQPYTPGETVRVTIPFEHLRGGDDHTGTFRVVYVVVTDGHVASRSWVCVEYGQNTTTKANGCVATNSHQNSRPVSANGTDTTERLSRVMKYR